MITARGNRRLVGRLAVEQALADERRRMAADVHDLIMQDLSLALATARTLADDPASASQASIVVAAGERALAGARDVVDGLVGHDVLHKRDSRTLPTVRPRSCGRRGLHPLARRRGSRCRPRLWTNRETGR